MSYQSKKNLSFFLAGFLFLLSLTIFNNKITHLHEEEHSETCSICIWDKNVLYEFSFDISSSLTFYKFIFFSIKKFFKYNHYFVFFPRSPPL
ncbi:MAG: hypothetical protein GDA46_04340 [Bdellovibrionales bacterium]|nr:hypothetical protein [Bdellovibrionales bacterium]